MAAISDFSGIHNAFSFAYGVNGKVSPLRVIIGNGATGASTITVGPLGSITTADGLVIYPLATTAPILVGGGANQETVTPSAVSQNTDGSWTISATFSNLHGVGDTVSSATIGLIEAVNYAHNKGGLVVVDGSWVQAGGTNSTITSNKGYTNVSVLDARGTVSGSAFSFKAASNGSAMVATSVSWY